jgi:hypothetical protein
MGAMNSALPHPSSPAPPAPPIRQPYFLTWVNCLLDPARTPLEHLHAARAWCAWGLDSLGFGPNANLDRTDAFHLDTTLVNGVAISPYGAAMCIREFRRTEVFVQAMDAAIRAARERFPGETIHVVEAGCGPLAPLAFSMAARYPANEVSFTLLDFHPVALAGAKRLAEALGVEASIREYLEADATSVRLREAPHIIASEVLLRALTKEPQVAVTLNLAPQLREGGFFLPECIDVDAALFDSETYFRPIGIDADLAAHRSASIQDLGAVFRLEAAELRKLKRHGNIGFEAHTVTVPPHDTKRQSFQFFTRIRVFGDHVLTDFESSLNQPQPFRLPPEVPRDGADVRFVYEVSQNPGLRLAD